jgi:hypothetical protein
LALFGLGGELDEPESIIALPATAVENQRAFSGTGNRVFDAATRVPGVAGYPAQWAAGQHVSAACARHGGTVKGKGRLPQSRRSDEH